jgi:hypothetical protein
MNSPQNASPSHSDADLDRMLAAHFGEELTPSFGFALSVMESVQTETAAPPPLAFPWWRALPGLIAALTALAGFGIFALRKLHTISAGDTEPVQRGLAGVLHAGSIHLTSVEQALCWTVASACLSIAVAAGSMRLAGDHSGIMRV